MPRHPAATNLVGINTLERSGATTAHLFTTGTSLGLGAGCLLSGTSTSPSNTAFGHQALASLPNGSLGFNTAVGYTALQTGGASSRQCTAVGYQALKLATDRDNTAVGYNAGKAITTGIGNTLIGSGAGALTTTAAGNTVVGWDAAAQAGVGADGATCMGYRAGYTVTTGNANTFLGYSADGTASSTQDATAVGHSAKASRSAVAIGKDTVASANYSTALGSKASATALGAVAIGCDNSPAGATTAVLNEFKFGTANHRYNFPGQLNATLDAGTQKITNLGTPTVGTDAATMAYVDSKGGLSGLTTIDNTFVGISAGAANTGASNTCLGYNAGHSVTSSSNNVFIGMNAGGSITTATGNTLIGVNAGRFLVSGVGNSDNTLVGYNMGGNYTYENTYLGSGTGVSGNGTDYANTFIGKGAGGPMTGAYRSVCVGRNASIAAGSFALCTAVGDSAGANNTNATAIGGAAQASGNTSLALGPLTTASASYSGAIGANAIASAAGAWAFATDGAGAGATTSVVNEIKFGTVNHLYNFPGQLNQPLNAGTKKITNLGTPTVGTDAATMAYVDSKTGGAALTGTTTVDNTFLGVSAGAANTVASLNTFVGYQAGKAVTTSTKNVFIGANAGVNTTDSIGNTLIGYNAGSFLLASAGGGAYDNNTLIGFSVGGRQYDNTMVGAFAGAASTTGAGNTFVGRSAGATSTLANQSVCIGNGADLIAGALNYGTAVGATAKAGATAATAVGGAANASGANSTAVGYQAAAGNNAVALGYTAQTGSPYAIAIGQNAVAYATYGGAIGRNTYNEGSGSWAIATDSAGNGANTTINNEIKLGTALHTVNIPGALTVAGSAITGGGAVADGSITSAKIADGAIMNIDISASAGIALSKLATDPLNRANHTGTQLASTVSNFDTQVRTSRLDQMAGPATSLTLPGINLTDGTSIGIGSSAGTMIATSPSNKIGFWGTSPVVRDSGWTVGSYTPFRAGISSGLTLSDVANALSTLITVLKGYGLLA